MIKYLKNPIKVLTETSQLWIEKYRPKKIDEVAVHSKKVQEVLTWFETANGNDILLLSGPVGSGKSACVEALPNVSISVWNTGDVNSFTDFVLRASRYEVIDSVGFVNKKIILVDSLPNHFYEEPSQLHEVLINYKSLGKYPLVIVLSDSPIMKYSVHSLIPKALQQKLNIKSILFNPITITSMKKILTNIAKKEYSGRIKEKRLQEIIVDIFNRSGGDIRNAINNLQVFFSGFHDPNHDFNMSKDVHLFIFRALGKVLYCKRETDEDIIAASNKKESSFNYIPSERLRAPLLFNPEEVFDNSGLDSSTFINYLHENFVDFIEDMNQISNISDNLSYADYRFGHWSIDHCKLTGKYAVSVASRSICYFNQSRPKNTWRPLRKSPSVDISKDVAHLQVDILDVIEMDSSLLKILDIVSIRQALLYTIPYSKTIRRNFLVSKLYRNIFERIQFFKEKKHLGGFLEDNVPDVSSEGITGFMIKRSWKEQLWTVCRDMNEQNVMIEIDD